MSKLLIIYLLLVNSVVVVAQDQQEDRDKASQDTANNKPEKKINRAIVYPADGGFKLSEVEHGSDYHKFGLRTNDTILAINRKTLTQAKDGIQLLNSLKGQKQCLLTVRRNGSYSRSNFLA